jgi:hypothetical protein
MTKPAHIRAAALRDLCRQVRCSHGTDVRVVWAEMNRRGAQLTEDEIGMLWETFFAPSETERCS